MSKSIESILESKVGSGIELSAPENFIVNFSLAACSNYGSSTSSLVYYKLYKYVRDTECHRIQ